MKYLLMILLFACNLSSKIPVQYDSNEIERFTYYRALHQYYSKKADTMSMQPFIEKLGSVEGELFYVLQVRQYYERALHYMQISDSLITMINESLKAQIQKMKH